MKGYIFVAGATGAIGRPLCRLLVADGWTVTGSTRSPDKVGDLKKLGVRPAVVDVYDPIVLSKAVADAMPEAVIHQLTDLPPGLDPTKMAEAAKRNTRIRDEGTRNLINAATTAGATRIIAQSIAFAYASGQMPYSEESPIDPYARDVLSLEDQVLHGPLMGIVLRYGRLYGPGTGFDAPPEGGPCHVDEAADAARLALTSTVGGVYNIAAEDGTVSAAKAADELGWKPGFRLR